MVTKNKIIDKEIKMKVEKIRDENIKEIENKIKLVKKKTSEVKIDNLNIKPIIRKKCPECERLMAENNIITQIATLLIN